jgi:HSP20 family molecular chaperone IbpA
MIFATATTPAAAQLRRQAYAQAGRSAEKFLSDALFAAQRKGCTTSQDETSFTITMDVPGISKEQLGISIDGNVVRIQSKEGASRSYRAAYELPHEIDSASSEARLDMGVLTLRLAKKVPVDTSTEIVIQ